MKQKTHVQLERRCCVCNRAEKRGAKNTQRVNILALSPVLYRRGIESKGQIKNAGRAQVCEECFIAALAPGAFTKAKEALFNGIAERLRGCYHAMIEES